MLFYSSLTTWTLCTDKLIKYFIDKTSPDWSLENDFLPVILCYTCSSSSTLRTAVNHVGVSNDCIEQCAWEPWACSLVFTLIIPPRNTSGSNVEMSPRRGASGLLPGLVTRGTQDPVCSPTLHAAVAWEGRRVSSGSGQQRPKCSGKHFLSGK